MKVQVNFMGEMMFNWGLYKGGPAIYSNPLTKQTNKQNVRQARSMQIMFTGTLSVDEKVTLPHYYFRSEVILTQSNRDKNSYD